MQARRMHPQIRDKPPLNCYKKQTSFLSFLIAIVVDIMNDNTTPPLLWRGGWGVRPETTFTLTMSITLDITIVVDIMNDNTAPLPEWRGGTRKAGGGEVKKSSHDLYP